MQSVRQSRRDAIGGFLATRGHLVALALIVGVALFFRLYGIRWDQGAFHHPDEVAILVHVHDLDFPKHDLGSLFTTHSALNPAWFPYGSLPLYLLKLIGFLAPPFFHNPSLTQLAVIGRATSAVFDVITVVFVYIVAARLFNRWAGLLGAAIIALSALHIQQSHFFVTDIMLASWLMVSFYFLTRAMDSGRLKHFALAALFFGFATATKVSAAPFALAFATAAVLYATKDGRGGPELGQRLRRAALALALAGGVAFITFAVTQPYAIIDWHRFWGDVSEQSEMVRRIRDYPFTRQYVDTTPYLYHIKQLTVWGMGIPAGLLLWAGLVFSAGAGVWKRHRGHILLLSWVVPYFAITGGLDVKFMRYMMPITPFLAIMAGSMVTSAYGWIKERRSALLRPQVVYGVVGAAMVFTLLYSVAYVRIYAKPHPATAAAAWINRNVPSGATIAQTHWENGLPNLGSYRAVTLELYNDDNATKRAQLIDQLTQADYLAFYSNRLYGTIPRLPDRYPLSTAYFRELFNGELGYQLVHWEASYPNLFGVSIVHDTLGRPGLATPEPLEGFRQTKHTLDLGFADESFTVYDHPLVLIFKKTLTSPPQDQRAFFAQALPDVQLTSSGGGEKVGLVLSPDDARAQQTGGTWSRLFSPSSFVNSVPWAVWFLVVQLAFLLALPITLTVFRWLPDRGYLLGKMLGVLLLSYIPWLLASLHWIGFSRLSVGLGLLGIAAVSAPLFWHRRDEILDFLRRNKRMIIAGELVFLAAFAGMYAIRVWNPDLWHPFRGGEKPMDFAYFNAVVRSTYMPPYDPWFSGGYLNYYYYGQFMNAALTKFTGIVPSIAINLATPMFFALTAAAVFSIVYNLAVLAKRRLAQGSAPRIPMPSPLWAGLIGVALVLIAGNMDGIVQVSQGVGRVVHGGEFGSFDFWRSSRMMPSDVQGITEFPYFTFLFADPHAHLFVMPLTLLALGLALTYVLGARPPASGGRGLAPLAPLALLGLTLGAILATNSWDVITYAVIGAAAVVIAEYAVRRRLSLELAGASVVKVAFLAGAAALFFLPYIASYEAPIADASRSFFSRLPLIGGGVNTITNTFTSSDTQTALWRYLGVYGIFIFVLVSLVGYMLWRRYQNSFRAAPSSVVMGFQGEAGWQAATQLLGWGWAAYVAGVAVAVGVSIAAGYTTVAFLAALLALLVPLVLREVTAREEGMPTRLFLYVLMAVPLLLGIFVDLFTFRNDVGRMNTVFKFYLQAWVLLGIIAAYGIWRLRFGLALKPRGLRWGWQGLLLLLAAAVMIYPVMATPVRARDRFDTSIGPSTNGASYLETAVYHDYDRKADLVLKWDQAGIQWLEDNVQGSPVIVEGLTPLYRWGNRVSVNTGLPAVIGWDWHQKQQRWKHQAAVDQRRRDVNEFFSAPSVADAEAFLQRYNVRYVYVGQLERAYYPAAGLAKFDAMAGQSLDLVYQNEQVKIYQVR